MRLEIRLRRIAYRLAYRGLRVWWLLSRPRALGVKCVLSEGERILLVRHTYGPDEWQLPGGRMRRNEPPVDAARREIQEELGIGVESWRALGPVEIRESHRRDTVHCFAAELSEPELTIDEGELAEARWFERDRLPERLSRHARPIIERAGGV